MLSCSIIQLPWSSLEMLTRFGSRALSALGYGSNDESATENETNLYDSTVISGDWVFVRQKRPQRSCTKRNSSQTEEWFTVTRKRNKIKPTSENASFEYDTMDDLLESEQDHNKRASQVENHNNSVSMYVRYMLTDSVSQFLSKT